MLSPTKLILESAVRHRSRLVASSGLVVIESLVALAEPWLVAEIARALLLEHHVFDLATAFGLLVGLLALEAAVSITYVALLSRVYTSALLELRAELYDQLQWQTLESHARRGGGDTLTLLDHDVDAIAQFVSDTIVAMVPAAITVVGAATMMVYVSPVYGVAAVAMIPVYVVVLRLASRHMARFSKRVAHAHSDANAVADEQLRMLPVVKAFGREETMRSRYRRFEEVAARLRWQLHSRAGALGPGARGLAALAVVCLLWSMSGAVTAGSLAVSDYLMFFMYSFLFARPLSSMAGVYGAVSRTHGSAARLADVFGQPSERRGGRQIARFERDIEFVEVGFAYPGRRPVFDNLSLQVRQGEVTAILGPNGAGKSTLLKLLLGFATPQKGLISIDGVDTVEIDPVSLRGLFGVVPQELMLLSGSIFDNIALGRSGATLQQVKQAAKLARADEFIDTLPDGYNTPIGEGGSFLSGGQRQRIALARAVLKNAPILVLDEATSMLDSATEAAFFDSCREAFRGRTVLVVCHHLSDLTFADQVVELGNGGANSTRARGARAC